MVCHFPIFCLPRAALGLSSAVQIQARISFRWTQSHYYTAHTSINMMLAAEPEQWDSCQLELLGALCMHGAL